MCETFAVSKGDLYLDMNEQLPDVSEKEKLLAKLEKQYKEGKISDTTFEKETDGLSDEIAKGHDYRFVGRVGQFCPIKPGCNGGVLYRVNDGKNYAATGSKGYRWMESEVVKELGKEAGIDRSFYEKLIDEAIEDISKYGDFEWFVSDDPYVPQKEAWMDIPYDPEGIPFN